ncbi:MAG: hypothetical protein ACT4P5_18160 [Armatimonadota bacterium]
MRPLSSVARRISGLAWSPHSDKVAYGSLQGEAQAEIHIAAVNGTAQILVTGYPLEFPDPAADLSVVWSPDGRQLAYGTNTGSMAGPVWLVRFGAR